MVTVIGKRSRGKGVLDETVPATTLAVLEAPAKPTDKTA